MADNQGRGNEGYRALSRIFPVLSAAANEKFRLSRIFFGGGG